MLPILLMILKIIGIVILVLLGLVLALLLLVLFVPVRYRVSGAYYGKVQGTVKVTWLLHALSLKVTYEDGLDVIVRVLGKRVFQEKEGAAEAEEELKEETRKAEESVGEGLPVDFVESADDDDLWEEDDDGQEVSGKERYSENAYDQAAEFEGEDIWSGEQGEDGESGTFARDERSRKDDGDDFEDEEGEASQDSLKKGADRSKQKRKRKDRKRRKRKADSDPDGLGVKEKLRRQIESVKSTWARLEEYKEKAVSFWNDERNQKTIRVILRQIRAVIRHVLPRKVRGKVVFGFENPSTTGKILSAFSVAYAWYGDKLEIVPVFDQSILEVEGSLKGRVQAGVMAARAVRVLLNKNFRRLAWSLIKNGGK